MPFLTTGEAQEYLQSKSIALQDKDLRAFVVDRTVKGHRRFRNYLYDKESIEAFAESNPNFVADSSESFQPNRNRLDEAADGLRSMLDPQERLPEHKRTQNIVQVL